MNERIKELAIQAKHHSPLILQHWGKIEALTDSEQEELENIEKFAELIVKECIDCALWVGNINSAQTDPIRTAHAIKHRILNKLLKVEE